MFLKLMFSARKLLCAQEKLKIIGFPDTFLQQNKGFGPP
jgi:hypothetical protein